jgi:hypothetical protein
MWLSRKTIMKSSDVQTALAHQLRFGTDESANELLENYSMHCNSSVLLEVVTSQEGYFSIFVGDAGRPLHVSQDVEETAQYSTNLIDGNF